VCVRTAHRDGYADLASSRSGFRPRCGCRRSLGRGGKRERCEALVAILCYKFPRSCHDAVHRDCTVKNSGAGADGDNGRGMDVGDGGCASVRRCAGELIILLALFTRPCGGQNVMDCMYLIILLLGVK
jgi:hypothetical protein